MGSIQINFAIMILYCCCLDVDDDTDSHPSSFLSCFGLFYFAMKLSSRDRRINGVVADLRRERFNRNCNININCSASYLLRNANVILVAISRVIPPFEGATIIVEKGGVYSKLNDFDPLFWDGVEIEVVREMLTPVPAPALDDDSDDLPF